MTVCLKCGAENPQGLQYCTRCEMPLPDSGVGGTLTGAPIPGVSPPGTLPLGPADRQLASAPRPPGPGAPPPAYQTRIGGPARAAAAAAPAEAPAASGFHQTLFGVAPTAPLPGAPAAASGGGTAVPSLASQTLFGVAPPAASPSAAFARPAPAAARSAVPDAQNPQRTFVGVIPDEVARQLAAHPAPVASQHSHERPHLPASTAPFEAVRNASTLLGSTRSLPPASTAPVAAGAATFGAPAASGSSEPSAAPPSAAPEPALVPPHPLPMLARTQLGVATPGIAPLRAGNASAPPPQQTVAQPPAAPRAVPERTMAEGMPPSMMPPSATPLPVRLQVPRSALVLLTSGIVLLAAAAAFALLWKGTKPISAALSSDASGKDRIDLLCSQCPDGTLLSLAEVSAEVKDRKAYLAPKEQLPLGSNTLSIALQRPGEEHPETVEVRLPPLEYRVHLDTSTLVGDKPSLRLDLEALPGTRVLLAGRELSLDESGHGSQQLEVTGELTGPSSEVATFEQSVSYAITPPSGKDYSGELRFKIGVTPLILEAPGSDSVTDTDRFMLAGRTTRGAQVWVADHAIAVDEDGRFAQPMAIDSVGETKVTVRATQHGLAPRFASFRLERVASLAQALKARSPGALPLSSVTQDIAAHVGKLVLVRGKIEEVRVDGHHTLLVLAADRDCVGNACLARLLYGGIRKLERGASITALGRVRGTAGSQNVPEIEVSLLL